MSWKDLLKTYAAIPAGFIMIMSKPNRPLNAGGTPFAIIQLFPPEELLSCQSQWITASTPSRRLPALDSQQQG